MLLGLGVSGTGCGGEDSGTQAGSKTGTGGGSSSLAEVSCPSGTKVKLGDIPDCAGYVEKWTKDCCPKATVEYTGQTMQAMLCTGVNATALNSACKAALDASVFTQACNAVKSSPVCN
jgi:hypothetical protein